MANTIGKQRFLVLGAGVLGTFYGAKLARSGHQVTILARHNRAKQIRTNGLVVDERHHGQIITKVDVIERLEPDEYYDYVLVFVRNDQVCSVLPILSESNRTPNIVFMCNNPTSTSHLVEALGHDRVILGFPGAGGERGEDGTVQAIVVMPLIQKTTLGELDGNASPRIRRLAAILRQAGFPTVISCNMEAWLKTHVALVCPIADAFYEAGSNMKVLASNRFLLKKMIQTVRAALSSLQRQGVPITPSKLQIIRVLPKWVLVAICHQVFCTAYAELIIARHASGARGEMEILSRQLREMMEGL